MFQGVSVLMTRALREDARLLKYHLCRFLFIGIMLVFVGYASYSSLTLGAPGLEFFHSLIFMDLFLIWLAGISYFVSPVTEEKEEETLGLLKMAGISPLGLLLGKSTSRIIVSLVYLTLQLPFTILAITLGGVTMRQILAAFVCLLASLFFTANLALLFSVTSRRTRDAAQKMIVTSLILEFGPPLINGLSFVLNVGTGFFDNKGSLGITLTRAGEWLTKNSAFLRLFTILKTGFDEPILSQQVYVAFASGLASFIAAWALFERSTRDLNNSGPVRAFTLDRLTLNKEAIRERPCWTNPFLWKDFHFMVGGVWGWCFRIFILFLAVAGIFLLNFVGNGRVTIDSESWLTIGMFVSSICIGVDLILIAGRFLSEERKWHTLSVLFLTPHGRKYIIYSKMAGCLLGALPMALLAAFCGFALSAIHPHNYHFIDDWSFLMGMTSMALYALVFLHVITLYSLFLKWGAIPAAIATMMFGSMCIGPLGMIMSNGIQISPEGFLTGSCLGLFILNVLLHMAVDARLDVLIRE